MKKQTAVRYNSKEEFFAIIGYMYDIECLPKTESFRGHDVTYSYAFFERYYNYYNDTCTCIILEPFGFINAMFEHKYNVISFNEFNEKYRQMKKQTIALPKGMTANKINVCVEDEKILVSYEVEPIKPEYKCGDVVVLKDGAIGTVAEWNRAFWWVLCSCVLNNNQIAPIISYSRGAVLRLATHEEATKYHKALRDAGYEWDAEKMEFVEIEWKPKFKRDYYYLLADSSLVCRVCNSEWGGRNCDLSRFAVGNCFRTEEAAQVAADQIKEVLKNAKKE